MFSKHAMQICNDARQQFDMSATLQLKTFLQFGKWAIQHFCNYAILQLSNSMFLQLCNSATLQRTISAIPKFCNSHNCIWATQQLTTQNLEIQSWRATQQRGRNKKHQHDAQSTEPKCHNTGSRQHGPVCTKRVRIYQTLHRIQKMLIFKCFLSSGKTKCLNILM